MVKVKQELKRRQQAKTIRSGIRSRGRNTWCNRGAEGCLGLVEVGVAFRVDQGFCTVNTFDPRTWSRGCKEPTISSEHRRWEEMQDVVEDMLPAGAM